MLIQIVGGQNVEENCIWFDSLLKNIAMHLKTDSSTVLRSLGNVARRNILKREFILHKMFVR